MKPTDTSKQALMETAVYLDFSEKIPPEMLDHKVFIRIANLKNKNPLVQINDMIFKGTYDYSVGTNLFFKKTSNSCVTDFPFQQPINVRLEMIEAQTKVLNCKQMRVPPTSAIIPINSDNIQYNFTWSYEELLNKFDQSHLNLKDMIKHEDHEVRQEEAINQVCQKGETSPISIESNKVENIEINYNEISKVDEQGGVYPELEAAYENLQMLARKPVKHKVIDEIVECDPIYCSSYEFKNIECKVLEPPHFSYFNNHKNFDNISDCIDINRCVRLGIVESSNNFPRVLSDNERKRVLTIENFEYLNLTARYLVILHLREELEKQINSNSIEENSKKDEFSHSPIETLNIFHKLLSSLKKRIQKDL